MFGLPEDLRGDSGQRARLKNEGRLDWDGHFLSLTTSRLGHGFNPRVALRWAPVRPQRGPYTGRGARTEGLLSDRTRD